MESKKSEVVFNDFQGGKASGGQMDGLSKTSSGSGLVGYFAIKSGVRL